MDVSIFGSDEDGSLSRSGAINASNTIVKERILIQTLARIMRSLGNFLLTCVDIDWPLFFADLLPYLPLTLCVIIMCHLTK